MSLGKTTEPMSGGAGRSRTLSQSAQQRQDKWRESVTAGRGGAADPAAAISSRRCLFGCNDPAVATSVGLQVLMKASSVGFFLFLLFGEINVPFVLCAVLLGLMLPGFAVMRYEFLSAQQTSPQTPVAASASVFSQQSGRTNTSIRSRMTVRTVFSLFEPEALAPERPTPMGVSTRSLATNPGGVAPAQSSRSFAVSSSVYSFPFSVSGADLSLSSRRSIRSIQQGVPASDSMPPERSMKSKVFGWYVLVSGTCLQAFPGAMLLQLALKDSHPAISWGAAGMQFCFLDFKTITTEAAPAFEKYTGKEIQLEHPVLKFLGRCLAEMQPRFEAGTSAWSAAGALYQLAKTLYEPAAIPSLIGIVPLVLPMYVAKADLYRAFDAMKLQLRTLGLTSEQQSQLFRGETLDLYSELSKRACVYRAIDGAEYVLLGWTGWVLQRQEVNKISAALAYGGRFAKIAINIALQYSLAKQGDWQVPLLVGGVVSLGLFQGFVAGKVKFRKPAPGAVINFQDPHVWLEFVTSPCTPRQAQSAFDTPGGESQLNPMFVKAPGEPLPPSRRSLRAVTVFRPVLAPRFTNVYPPQQVRGGAAPGPDHAPCT